MKDDVYVEAQPTIMSITNISEMEHVIFLNVDCSSDI